MRLAIAAARGNPAFPFGAVIVRKVDRQVMATGVNTRAANPTFHGEIVAINDYVARHGNLGWGEVILYTTGEPCAMCMGAILWSRIGRLVFATSVAQLATKIDQIMLTSADVAAKAPFVHISITGGVLAVEAMQLFTK